MPATTPLTVRIRLSDAPRWDAGPLVVGLQTKRGELLARLAPAPGLELQGTIEARLGKDGNPDFAGNIVHGRPGGRFLYLSWRQVGDHGPVMFRRLKLYLGPLRRATWEQPGLDGDALEAGTVVAEVAGAGPYGGPACGTARVEWRSCRGPGATASS